jgi:rubrerythrin
MTVIETQIAKSDSTRVADDRGTAAEERRVNLLRQIAVAGGTIAPSAQPNAEHGYAYAGLGDDVERDLGILTRRNYLEARFFDRVSLCPKCGSHHLNVREVCPSCRRAHVAKDGLLHHFRCGYVSIPSEFLPVGDGGYICPKCKGKMHHLGTEFDRLGNAFVCRGCGIISENPPVEAVCLSCNARTPAEDLVSTIVFSYILTSRGAAAVRRGSLFDDEEELISVTDAAVHSRKVILEFLHHEMKRLQHFNIGFSVLLADDPTSNDSSTPSLTRLRQCLRDVDLIGQLADSLYLAILPQTKRREAETLRQQIVARLGSHSPISLSTFEITKPEHLAQVFASLKTRGQPS